MNKQELKALPKVELHCHFDGSLPASFVADQLGREVRLEELQVSEACTSLAEYLEKFDLPIRCLSDANGLKTGAKQFLQSLKEENVVYVEVRFAPLQHISEDLSTGQVIEAVLEGLEEGKKETGIEYNVIVCLMRHHGEAENRQLLVDALPYLGKGVCSVDLAGGEATNPMCNYMDIFTQAKEMGYRMTIHAGECGSAQNIVDSVSVGAARVGHGIAMTGNEAVKALCKEKGIGLEMCPISNIQTKAIDAPEHYPIREFLEEGLLVTINTDNRTVSGTSLTREYEWLQKNHKVTDEEIKKIIRNALEVSFASEQVKEKLRGIL